MTPVGAIDDFLNCAFSYTKNDSKFSVAYSFGVLFSYALNLMFIKFCRAICRPISIDKILCIVC